MALDKKHLRKKMSEALQQRLEELEEVLQKRKNKQKAKN
jgi:hypothetical protein